MNDGGVRFSAIAGHVLISASEKYVWGAMNSNPTQQEQLTNEQQQKLICAILGHNWLSTLEEQQNNLTWYKFCIRCGLNARDL